MCSMAQSPGIVIEDYTSSISNANVNGNSVSQQVGAPLDTPSLIKGDDILLQGLFSALTGVSYSTVGIDDVLFSEVAEVAIEYDATLKSLTISVPESLIGSRLMLVNMKGENVLITEVNNYRMTVDLSTYAPGVYMAGVATQNSIIKSLKFNLK